MNFNSIFCPNSIALVGASRDETSVGYSLLFNLLSGSYKGEVYPINPKTDQVLGKQCYKSLLDLPVTVDLVIIAIPAAFVPQILTQVAEKNIHSVIIIAAGFKEAGEQGKVLEQQVVDIAKQHDITLIGPNCLGILNPHIGLNASFETVLPAAGAIGFISQSGALISAILDIANERGIGFSKIVSVGNKALISEHELLPYLFDDPLTNVILIYAEVLEFAPQLITLIRNNIQSSTPKPVILLKAGASSAGQKASSSHTGSLARSDTAYEALVQQAGILRVHTIDELLSTAHVIAKNGLPKGDHLAIITNAGGPGIIATDEAERRGLQLASFSTQTQASLQTILPSASHISNPVDVLGDATHERYEKTLAAVVNDENVDEIIAIVTPQSMTDIPETASSIVKARDMAKKPIVATFIGAPHVETATEVLNACDVAHTQFPEDAVTALALAAQYSRFRTKKYETITPTQPKEELKAIFRDLSEKQVDLVSMETVFQILTLSDLPVAKNKLVQTKEEAQANAKTVGDTVVLKIVSPDISHKTDAGGVKLNIPAEEAGEAFAEILTNVKMNVPTAKTHGVLISEMIRDEGSELIIGVKREQGLGTMIMLGLGGIYVELFKDVVFRFAPLTRQDAIDMVDGLKAKQLLMGFRGSKKRDIEAVIEALLKVSSLAVAFPEISELDINPFFAKEEGKGGIILDARILLSQTK